MKIKHPWERLNRFWGKVDEKHNQLIRQHLKCGKILDIGCGYGALVNFLDECGGYDAVGIDTDPDALKIARQLHPGSNYKLCTKSKLEFQDEYFDAVTLKEILHHIYRETDIGVFLNEIKRVLKKQGRIIIFDPNPNPILRLARKCASHKDPECSFPEAISLLRKFDFRIRETSFYECLALPLSGGYVGLNLVPNITSIHKALIYLNDLLSRLLSKIQLGRACLWRYLIVADK